MQTSEVTLVIPAYNEEESLRQFLPELLDRLRIRNYVIQRGGLLKFQPLEKIVVSRRNEHCGGCQHNCFLSNPGCGVGRDKAMRKSG